MKEISSQEFNKEVLSAARVAVEFYSTECSTCEAFAAKLENIQSRYGSYIQFVKIFRKDNIELAESFGVKSSPSILFFNSGSVVGTMLSGDIKKIEVTEQLDTMLSDEEIAEVRATIKPSESYYDIAILGGGPAGLTAALYSSQAKLSTVVIDTQFPGGQVNTTHKVTNYPGFVQPQLGYMLAQYMSEQSRNNGVDFRVAVDIRSIDLHTKSILIDNEETIHAKRIIIATGAHPRSLGIPGEVEYKGKGISYSATCDAKYLDKKHVIVIGGGNSAVDEALFITKYAQSITLIHQHESLTANKQAQEEIRENPKVRIINNSEPRAYKKENDTLIVVYENSTTKELCELSADGVFVFVGMQPNAENFQNQGLEFDQWGYIITNDDMQTNLKDVYAVGDIRSKKYRQITTAVADATIASIHISKTI